MRKGKRNIFASTSRLDPGRTMFDLSYDKKFTADMGQLIPVMCDEMVPGDVFKISNNQIIRFQPLVAPVLHEINAYVHYYFVPYRLLWDNWELFVTGGPDGTDDHEPPTWIPTPSTGNAIGSLWDYLGFPTGVSPAGAYPLDFPRAAYNMVYNWYYRDENLQDEVLLTNEQILRRNWEKDYSTTALPWQQRGIAPALPIAGVTHASFPASIAGAVSAPVGTLTMTALNPTYSNHASTPYRPDAITREMLRTQTLAGSVLSDNTVDLSVATTFDVADLRTVVQLQKWLERNARGGVRYIEFLREHFGQAPRDERLQMPEYVGGTKNPVIVSEVLQTSETDTSPQGNQAGHAISVGGNYAGSYHALEYGLIIGLLSVMPRTAYQQGINRQWLRRSRYDFYFPEFAHLSEQAVERCELYATDVEADNLTIFGYQGRYDEMRTKDSIICGEMRSSAPASFDYWHLARYFSSPPLLNSDFIVCNPRKDIFAVPSVPGLIVNFSNLILAYRPLPYMSDPGLMDHF
jgi:hypothetical protein